MKLAIPTVLLASLGCGGGIAISPPLADGGTRDVMDGGAPVDVASPDAADGSCRRVCRSCDDGAVLDHCYVPTMDFSSASPCCICVCE